MNTRSQVRWAWPAFVAAILAMLLAVPGPLMAQQPANEKAIDEAALDAALAEMAAVRPGDSAAYRAARDKVMAFGADAIPALEARATAENWTRENWLRALCAAICRDRLADRELAAAIDHPHGLAPEDYSNFVTGKPAPGRFLARLRERATPLLIERWRWTFADYPFSEGERGEWERLALRDAILFVPGRWADARAQFFFGDVMADAAQTDGARAKAAQAYGQTAGADGLANLRNLLADDATPDFVKIGCIHGIGAIPDPAAATTLADLLAAAGDSSADENSTVTADQHAAIVAALGKLGSAWGWRARGDELVAVGNATRAVCADALVQALHDSPQMADAISAALCVTAWPASLAALEAMAANENLTAAQRAAVQQVIGPLKTAIDRQTR